MPQQAAQLARIICRLGAKFSIKNDLVFSIEGYTIDLIKKCISLQTVEDRCSLAAELVELSSPIGLALHLHDVLWEEGCRDDGNDQVLNTSQLTLFEQSLFMRLLRFALVESLTTLDEGDLRRFFHAMVKHNHDIAEFRDLLNRLLDEEAGFSIMAPTIYSTRLNKKEPTRNRIKSELAEDDYTVLQRITPIEKLYQCTLEQYGRQAYLPSVLGPYPELSDHELIGQF